MRDTQRGMVYQWERIAFSGFWTERKLAPYEARALIDQILGDVRAAGGHACDAPVIKFTKRRGGACASWASANFTQGSITVDLVCHEVAHMLTSSYTAQRMARMARMGTDKFLDHVMSYFCPMGHGPRYVACYLALMERYCGHAIEPALQLARSFQYNGMGPWVVTETFTRADGRKMVRKERKPMVRTGRVAVDHRCLNYWRSLLSNNLAVAA